MPENSSTQMFIQPDTKLNFEQRVLAPSKYPVLQNKDGTVSTHRMAWGDSNGKFFAYPTIVQLPDGQLHQLTDEQAWHHAMETKEYREFSTPEDANAYASGGYKNQWGLLDGTKLEDLKQ